MNSVNLTNFIFKSVWRGCTLDGKYSHNRAKKGQPKARFTREEAYQFIERHNKRGKCPWEPYLCQECWSWHIGRRSGSSPRESLAFDILELGERAAKAFRNENSPYQYYYLTKLREHWEQQLANVERRRLRDARREEQEKNRERKLANQALTKEGQ